MTWREYHAATAHSANSLSRAPQSLDWANMPDPFRHYDGVPVLDLPADPPAPGLPALEVLEGARGSTAARDGAAFLSQLLFYSAAISAAKRVPSTGYKYALRVNPSSGNLHPTEFHFITRGLKEWPDGLYHYRASSHAAEQRALGDFSASLGGASAPIVFLLTSIPWREAWKYRERAYRYCLHDMGHAWQALALAARAIGCESYASGYFPDDHVARLCRLSQDEWPLLMVALRGSSIPLRDPDPHAGEAVWFGGQANRLSVERSKYPLIDAMQGATKLSQGSGTAAMADPMPGGSGTIELPHGASSTCSFGEVVRQRRSALDFRGGTLSMSQDQLAAILQAATMPLDADFATARFVQLYLYVHRVDGMEPGVYRHWPERGELELLRSGDQRVVAAGLSLGQDLAGNACVAFSMMAGLERAGRAYGTRGYRYAHFEAGATGHRMYLAAEALGLQATGIGAFFDDRVNQYLEPRPEQSQVVYHFAIGHAVTDPRLDA
ncbi:MAG: SagB/ThcOx family dehydrogenase [Acidobacteria bacterium]|nr:SagB/ThcOx family dehydrogenase [Acidobacteriota bacterium]